MNISTNRIIEIKASIFIKSSFNLPSERSAILSREEIIEVTTPTPIKTKKDNH
jgi:hypothetical protein